MKNDINSNEDTDILIEASDGSNHPVSFQLVQSIYNEITGEKEVLSKSIYLPFKIAINDIQQLNIKFDQFKEQYNVANENSTITVAYENDTKEVFSSFERFLLINSSNTSPIKLILLQYNFLIVLPKTQKPQTYSIEIRLRSLARYIVKKDKEKELTKLHTMQTAYYEVNYVDYIVGQSLMDLTQRWFESLSKKELSPLIKYIQKNYRVIDDGLSMMFFTIFMIFIYIFLQKTIPESTQVFLFNLLSSLLIGLLLIIYALVFSGHLSLAVRRSIKKIYPLSYIKVNKGDERVIEKFKSSGIIKGFVTLILSLGIGIASSIFAWYLTN